MFSRSAEALASMKVTKRSMKACISVRPSTSAGASPSQKEPIRSSTASPPKPSMTQIRARRPPMRRSRLTRSQLRPTPSVSSNQRTLS